MSLQLDRITIGGRNTRGENQTDWRQKTMHFLEVTSTKTSVKIRQILQHFEGVFLSKSDWFSPHVFFC